MEEVTAMAMITDGGERKKYFEEENFLKAFIIFFFEKNQCFLFCLLFFLFVITPL